MLDNKSNDTVGMPQIFLDVLWLRALDEEIGAYNISYIYHICHVSPSKQAFNNQSSLLVEEPVPGKVVCEVMCSKIPFAIERLGGL